MSIYTRDNINYSQMLQNAIANRARAAEREAEYTKNKYNIWGDAVTNIGGMIGRGIGGYNAWRGNTTVEDEEEAELEMLKKQLEEYQANQTALDNQRAQVESATNLMKDYRPNDGTYTRYIPYEEDNDNPYKLPGNRNATQSDYVNYLMEMNRLYGGL